MFDLTPALVVALAVGVWRVLHRRNRGVTGPLPDVGDAPPGAKPIATLRLSEDGLVAYVLSATQPAESAASDRPPGRRS